MQLRFLAQTLSVSLMLLMPCMAGGQTASTNSGPAYPNKPVRIVAAAAGGGSDFGARLVAQELTGGMGQQVIVDNRGVTGAEIVAKAPPDGYTLLFSGSALWLTPFLRSSVSYDPVGDFAPVILANTQPQILVVHPSLPAKSVKDLITLAKARPGELDYASGPGGSTGHLAGELFKALARINLVRIPYQGNGPVVIALLGGQVQLTFSTAGAVAPHLKSGKLRALAVTSAQPSALLPGMPTVAASGLPGYESVTITGIFAPAKTPDAVVNRLNKEIVRVLIQPDVKEKFLNSGADTVGGSPQEFAATIKSEMIKWGNVIRDSGIRGE